MKLFGGLMSSDDMEKEGHYYDGEGRSVVIQAGSTGWTIQFGDGTTQSGSVEDDATLNFAEAKAIAESVIGCKLRISLSEPVRKV